MVKVSLWSTELGQLVFEFSKWFEGVELLCGNGENIGYLIDKCQFKINHFIYGWLSGN